MREETIGIDLLCNQQTGPEIIKLFFKLNWAENEICSAFKKLNTSNLNFLPVQQNCAQHEIFPATKY